MKLRPSFTIVLEGNAIKIAPPRNICNLETSWEERRFRLAKHSVVAKIQSTVCAACEGHAKRFVHPGHSKVGRVELNSTYVPNFMVFSLTSLFFSYLYIPLSFTADQKEPFLNPVPSSDFCVLTPVLCVSLILYFLKETSKAEVGVCKSIVVAIANLRVSRASYRSLLCRLSIILVLAVAYESTVMKLSVALVVLSDNWQCVELLREPTQFDYERTDDIRW